MSYSKTNWVNDVTPINATNLNKIENQLETNTNAIDTKQARLVSGTNIKTINSTNILGSGNINIRDVTYRDWSQQFTCPQGMTTGSVSVPTVTGYTCVANVLRTSSSSYMMYELAANGNVKIWNHASGTLTVTLYGKFIYLRDQ